MKYLSLIITTITLLVGVVSCSSEKKTNSKIEKPSENSMRVKDSKPTNSQSDSYLTKMGDLNVTLVGHASLIFQINGVVIHIDPYSKLADYSKLPKADLIILTHEHTDHFDLSAIEKIRKENTHLIASKVCTDSLNYGETIENNDKTDFAGIEIQAVPAYNMVSKRPDGTFYHPKGRGNGYVLTFGSEKVYVPGDTENIPEMKDLNNIYIAFLPKNTPYTMTDDMFVDAVLNVSPVYLYPYHFSNFDDKKILKALEEKECKSKVLIRSMSNL